MGDETNIGGWTPGEWVADDYGVIFTAGEGRFMLGSFNMMRPNQSISSEREARANGKLAAASPNLYAALLECRRRLAMDLDEVRHLREWLSDSERSERAEQDEAADEASEQALAAADAALLKAQGQS